MESKKQEMHRVLLKAGKDIFDINLKFYSTIPHEYAKKLFAIEEDLVNFRLDMIINLDENLNK